MPLEAGQSLGPYQIIEVLGNGGMGEVYRALDPRVGREVAIKVSAQQFNERFEREARAIASLNHPNICTLFDVGPNYIVMELVEGESPKGPLPLDEALKIMHQIGDALEAAHEKGITHRDLKPANIKVRPDATVKVLDFGLAKVASTPAGSADDVLTLGGGTTQVGSIIGTPAYMPPEQAKGKTVDQRADIWAFGVIFHELLTGEQMHQGDTMTEVLASVVRDAPKLDQVPVQVRRLMAKCLEKDPKQRLRNIADVWALLDEAPAPVAAAPAPQQLPPSSRGSLFGWVAGGVGLILAGVLGFVHFRETPPEAEVIRFQAPLPDGVNFTTVGAFAVSPDERKIVFSATGTDDVPRLWIRNVGSLTADPVPASQTSSIMVPLFWSPDSKTVVYQTQGSLKRLDIGGGTPQTLCDAPSEVDGGSWNKDGAIIFSMNGNILRIPSTGGTATTVADPGRGAGAYLWPMFLPDGKHFLYSWRSNKPDTTGFYVGSLDMKPDAHSARLLPGGQQPIFAAGHLLFMREGGTLMAQAFDPVKSQVSGDAVPIAEHVSTLSQLGFFSIEGNALVYRVGSDLASISQLTWFNRQGQVVGTVGEPAVSTTVKVSPDGKRAAEVRIDRKANNADIWIVDLVSGASTRFTFDPGSDGNAVWSPDGNYIVWQSTRAGMWGIYRKAANGSGNDELLYQSSTNGAITDWTHDGRFILFHTQSPQTKNDIWALPLAGDHKPFPVIQTAAQELGGYMSPDGRWIAYISDESGRQEIYVQGFNPDAAAGSSPVSGKWMVSKGTLGMARWRGDGKELIFLAPDGAVMSVDVTANPVFQASAPKQLFQLPPVFIGLSSTPGALTDPTRDLQRFLVTLPAKPSGRQELTVVLNWPSALKK